ncbi:MAG: 2'-5' RNA ligase family protein [Candidatus Moraniibacteriota bacterium]
MNDKRYDIAIIPPSGIAEQAISMSRELQRFGACFVLDGQTYRPHISLYHVPLAEKVLSTVISILEKIAAQTRPFSLEQDTYYPDQGVWIGVRYIADKAILDLHTTVIAATKEYRSEQDDIRYLERWPELSPARRKNIEECGWSDAFAYYSPHISFTKLERPQTDVLIHLPHRDFSFLADHIGLYELGKHGTCAELVADFKLTE